MSDSWDDRRRAQEDGYFDALNKQALARLAAKQGKPALKSPVSGNPMELVTVAGVVIDRCVDSGGVWFDSGELARLLETAKTNPLALKEAASLLPTGTNSSQGSATGYNSPVSGKPMSRQASLGIHVYQCGDSGGTWVEGAELQRLMASVTQ
jgi:Zn-finger nucleic acid-binding protein